MSGEKTQIGIEINVAANGVSDVENNLKKISTALSSSETAAKSFRDSMASLKTTGLDNIAISTTGADQAKKDIQGVTRAINAATKAPAGILKKLNLGNLGKTLETNTESLSKFSKVLNELSQSSFFTGIATQIKTLELALGKDGAFNESIERLGSYFSEIGKLTIPANIEESINSLMGDQKEINLKVIVGTYGADEAIEKMTSLSTKISDTSRSVDGLKTALEGLSTTKNSIANLATSLKNVYENADSTTIALNGLNNTLIDSGKSYASIEKEAEAVGTVGRNANVAALLLEKMGTNAQKALEKANKSSKNLGKSLEHNKEEASELGKILGTIGTAFKYGVVYTAIYGIVDQLKDAVQLSAKLEQTSVRINLSGSPISQDQLSSIVTSNAQKYGVSQDTEQAAALEAVKDGARSYAEVQSIVAAANQVSINSNQDLISSVDQLKILYDSYAPYGETIQSVNDKIAASTRGANLNFKSYSDELSESAPIAAQMGVSLSELSAIYTTLVQGGDIKDTRSIADFLSSLANPTQDQINLLKQLNVAYGEVAIRQEGIVGVAQSIVKATGGNQALEAEALGDDASLKKTRILNLLTDASGKYQKILDSINNSQGDALNDSNKLIDTQIGEWDKLGASAQEAASKIASNLNNVASPAVKALNDLISTTQKNLYSLGDGNKDSSLPKPGNVSKSIGAIFSGPLGEGDDAISQGAALLGDSIKKEFSKLEPSIKNLFQASSDVYLGAANEKIKNDLKSLTQSLNQLSGSNPVKIKTVLSKPVNTSAVIKKDISGAPISLGNSVLPPTENIDRYENQAALELLNTMKKQVETYGMDTQAVIKYRTSLGDLAGASQQVKQELMQQAEAIDNQKGEALLKNMQQQSATFGQTADAVMRYRTSLGDLSDVSQSVKDKLIKQSEILEFQQAFQSLSESFSQNFTAFAMGSETAKEAFRSFAESTIQMLTELIIKMYAFKAVDALFGGAGGASGSAGAGAANAGAVASGSAGFFSSTAPAIGSSISSLSSISNSASRVASLGARNSSTYGGGIVINAPVTVHAPGATQKDATKIANQTSDAVTKNFRAIAQQEIARQTKPGGMLYR